MSSDFHTHLLTLHCSHCGKARETQRLGFLGRGVRCKGCGAKLSPDGTVVPPSGPRRRPTTRLYTQDKGGGLYAFFTTNPRREQRQADPLCTAQETGRGLSVQWWDEERLAKRPRSARTLSSFRKHLRLALGLLPADHDKKRYERARQEREADPAKREESLAKKRAYAKATHVSRSQMSPSELNLARLASSVQKEGRQEQAAAYRAAYRAANRERLKEQWREWADAHRDRLNAQYRQRYRRDRDRIRGARRARREALPPEEQKARRDAARAYYVANRAQILERQKERKRIVAQEKALKLQEEASQ